MNELVKAAQKQEDPKKEAADEELREQLKQRDQIIRRLKEEAQEKLSLTREEANQVASSDL